MTSLAGREKRGALKDLLGARDKIGMLMPNFGSVTYFLNRLFPCKLILLAGEQVRLF